MLERRHGGGWLAGERTGGRATELRGCVPSPRLFSDVIDYNLLVILREHFYKFDLNGYYLQIRHMKWRTYHR